jgi:hypothetical protein
MIDAEEQEEMQCKSRNEYVKEKKSTKVGNLVGRVGNCTLQCARQVDVEERSVHALHERNLATAAVSLAVCDIALELVFGDDVI